METIRTSPLFEGEPVFCAIDGSRIPKAIQPSDCQNNRIDNGRLMALNRLSRFAISYTRLANRFIDP
jgi:hypothetical protein